MAYILKFISAGANAESERFCFNLWGFYFVFIFKWNMQFNAVRLLAVQREVNDLLYAFANLLEIISTQT